MYRNMVASVLSFLLSLTATASAADCTPTGGEVVEQAFGKLPLYFIENQGQIDSDDVAYYVKGADKTLYFTPEGVTFSLQGGDERWTVKLDFLGARQDAAPRGAEKQDAVFSYFTGKPEDWKAGCPTYCKVVYEDLWPGIDLVFKGTVNRLKYEFVVEPGADPSQIRLAYRGASDVTTRESGELVVATPVASFDDGLPYAYQQVDGGRVEVSMAYRLHADVGTGHREYGFEIGSYDRDLPLVLDPEMLVYCGYIGGQYGGGGTGDDYGFDIAVDAVGSVYIAGRTSSLDSEGFPVVVGPDLTFNGGKDAFVAKVSATGESLVYCGYIGGSNWDLANGIAIDTAGAAYVAGYTFSSEAAGFPVVVGPDLTFNDLGGNVETDAFVAKVAPSGTALEYCGYIGGANYDYGWDIAVDGTGAAYVAGQTRSPQSTGFPVSGGPDLTYNGTVDAFIAKVVPSGASLDFCGYIGGSNIDLANGVALDGTGGILVTGETESSESDGFPVVAGPDLTHNGLNDVFVARISPSGTTLDYCGYIGGAGEETGEGIAADATGAAYVAGQTDSSVSDGFPILVGPDLVNNGVDGFVAKVVPTGAALEYCGYLGGSGKDTCIGIAVDSVGAAYVTGWTVSTESEGFPVLYGPDSTYNGGSMDAYVAKVAPSGAVLEYCGYIGGSSMDRGEGIAVAASGSAYVTGYTSSSTYEGFPAVVGPDVLYNGGLDAFVARLVAFDAPVPDIVVNGEDGPLVLTVNDLVTAAVSLDPRSLNGEPADFWIAVQKDGSATWWAQYRSSQLPKWTKSPTPIRFVGAFLRTVNNYTILSPRTLPPGGYVFFFAVDENKDGTADGSFIDWVEVTVN